MTRLARVHLSELLFQPCNRVIDLPFIQGLGCERGPCSFLGKVDLLNCSDALLELLEADGMTFKQGLADGIFQDLCPRRLGVP